MLHDITLEDCREFAASHFIDMVIHEEGIKKWPVHVDLIRSWFLDDDLVQIETVINNDFLDIMLDNGLISRERLLEWISEHAQSEWDSLGHDLHKALSEAAGGSLRVEARTLYNRHGDLDFIMN